MWVSGPLPRGRSHTRWSSSTSNEKRLTVRWRTRRTLPRQVKFRTLLAAALAKAQKEIRELKAAAKAAAARPSGAAAKDSTLAAGSGAKGSGKGAASKICFHFRDHGNCPKGDLLPLLPRQGAAQAGVGCQARGEQLSR